MLTDKCEPQAFSDLVEEVVAAARCHDRTPVRHVHERFPVFMCVCARVFAGIWTFLKQLKGLWEGT